MPVIHFPLTLTQQDIYFDQLHYPNNPLYNVGGYIKFGAVDREIVEKSHRRVVSEHESFGVRITNNAAGLSQYISDDRTLDLPFKDFSTFDDPEGKANEWLKTLFETQVPFNDCELFKAFLLKISDDEYWYIGFAHHLCMDGWGFANWANRIGQCYNDLSMEFVEVPTWQSVVEKDQSYIDSDKFKKDQAFWADNYKQLPEKLLPAQYHGQFEDKKRIPSEREILYVERQDFDDIAQCAKAHRVGINQLFTAMFAVHFSRLYGKDQIIFGVPAHNRQGHAQKQMLSVFTSTSPLLVDVNGEDSIASLANQIQTRQKKAYRHQRLPIGSIYQALELETGNKSMYDISMNYLKLDSDITVNGQHAELVYLDNNHEATPLMITIWEYGQADKIKFKFDYNKAYFNREDISSLVTRVKFLIENLIANVEKPVAQLSLLPPAEVSQLNDFSRANLTSRSSYQAIHQGFEYHAAENPEHTAVVYEGQQISYGQLNSKANQLARHIEAQGTLLGDKIGLCVERSIDMVVGILGILKVGCAYVTMDPKYPQDRLNYMVTDAKVNTVISQKSLMETLAIEANHCIFTDDWPAVLDDYDGSNLTHVSGQLNHNSLAYVLYTSGSTGLPKGVMIEHGNVLALYQWLLTEYSDEELKVVLGSTSLNFDLHVFEFWSALGSGNTLLLVDTILDLVNDDVNAPQYRPTLINTVPSAATVLLDEQKMPISALVLNLAGEALQQKVVNGTLQHTNIRRVLNLYGPSEDTTYSTYVSMDTLIDDHPNIGRQLDNTCAYVLDEDQNFTPLNMIGELYLGGAGVARGYLGKEEMTAERFVANPFNDEGCERLYRTGDLVRWLPNGQLAFIGRADSQVKLHGFRIELGEIENAFVSHENVKDAVVLVPKNSALLVAYVTAEKGDLAVDGLFAHVSQKVPEYMMPSNIMVMDEMPYLPNGKINRNALPAVDFVFESEYVPAKGQTETKLTEIWLSLLSDILGKQQLSVCDDFFRVGGNSLMATRIASACSKTFNKVVTVADIFANKTIRALAGHIDGLTQSTIDVIKPVAQGEQKSLSFAQRRLLFIQHLDSQNSQYNMPAAFNLTGVVNVEAIGVALNKIVSRHDILRTSYTTVDGVLTQAVKEHWPIEVQTLDLSDLSQSQRQQRLSDLQGAEYLTPFDLANEMPLRAKLVTVSERSGVLFITMHHVASDGWSVGVLVNEFNHFYQNFVEGESSELPALDIQYADYAAWLNGKMADDKLVGQLDYWRDKLQGCAPVHSLPLDYPRVAQQQFDGACVVEQIDHGLTDQLHRLASDHDVSLFMVLQSAFAALISRFSHESDVVMGTPISGRNHQQVEPLIGFFVNTLVVRSDLTENPSFSQLLHQTRQTMSEAFDNQWLPFDVLVDELVPDRSLSYSPLIQLMFTFESEQSTDIQMSGLEVERLDDLSLTAKFDITLQIIETADELRCVFNYATHIFSQQSMANLARCFSRLLQEVANQPDVAMEHINLNDDISKINAWCEGPRDYPEDQSLTAIFAEQVTRNPDAVALSCNGETVTYGQLDELTNQQAHYLLSLGVKVGDDIGVLAERSIATVMAMLACVKVGAAYVPLDPEYPKSRINFITYQCKLRYVFIDNAHAIEVDQSQTQLINIDDRQLYQQFPTTAVDVSVSVKDVAYIIYTSGSTGIPKGTMIEHLNIIRLLVNANFVELNSDTVMLQASSTAFDAATFEIWGSLLNGGQLSIYTDHVSELKNLNQHIIDNQVNTLWMTAGLFDQWSHHIPKQMPIKYLLVGGDVVHPQAVRRTFDALSDIDIINGYGPTENTVFTTCATIDREHSVNKAVPVGSAVGGTGLYLLNDSGVLTTIGEVGELHVAGDGLARGYIADQTSTRTKFVTQWLPDKGDVRLYKTGDLMRWNHDGQLEFIGRIDHQVKVRGFRIELGEIENTIAGIEGVHQTISIVQNDNGSKNIVAYVVLEPQLKALDVNEGLDQIRSEVKQILPDYMLPSTYMVLDSMPLTVNGKVDRNALPKADISAQLSLSYEAPRTEIESKLCAIWQGVLSLDKVGIHDNFFEIGGDSILSIQIISRANDVGIKLQTKQLFEHQTVAKLAKCAVAVGDVDDLAEQGLVSGPLTMLPIQRMWLGQVEQDEHHFNQGVLLQSSQGFDCEQLQVVAKALLTRHDALRLSFVKNGDWQGQFNGLDEVIVDSVCVSETLPQDDVESFVTERCRYYQGQFDLSKGQIIKMVNFVGSTEHYLFVVVHHLAIDGVSWRILLADLQIGLEQLANQTEVQLAAKTASYNQWGQWLEQYAQQQKLTQQQDYWLAQLQQYQSLPVDFDVTEAQTEQHTESVSVALSAEQTRTLLQHSNSAYQTQINDLLLSALYLAFSRWAKVTILPLTLESHGRQDLGAPLNIAQTIGWFTNVYPLRLESVADGVGELIKSVKEQLRLVPDGGVGFGLLTQCVEHRQLLDAYQQYAPQVVFNYLGQFDSALSAQTTISVSDIDTGVSIASRHVRGHQLGFNGKVVGGELSFELDYSALQYRQESIVALGECFTQALIEIIEHCVGQKHTQYTPSDFALADVEQAQLDLWAEQYPEYCDVYSTTAMQQGMIFHSMMHKDAYVTQTFPLLTGEINYQYFRQAWQNVVDRHDIMRTVFVGHERVLQQLVRDQAQIPWHQQDLSSLDQQQQHHTFEQYRVNDKQNGFDLSQCPLMRIALFNLGNGRHQLLWTLHHSILDGWCLPIIYREVVQIYQALSLGKPVNLPQPPKYRDYIQWLATKDVNDAKRFWQNQLANIETATVVAVDKDLVVDADSGFEELAISFTKEQTEQLQAFAKEHKTTVNTLYQLSWAYLLHRLTGLDDVVFGVTTAGRSAQIQGVEQMVGLFINTIAVPFSFNKDSQTLDAILTQHQNFQDCNEHSYLSLVDIQKQAPTGQGDGLFDSLLVFENFPQDLTIEGEQALPFEIESFQAESRSNYKLTLSATLLPTLHINCEYREQQFELSTIETLLERFKHILLGLSEVVDGSLYQLDVLSESERQHLTELNQTAVDYDTTSCIQQLFAAQVEENGDETALIYDDEETSYQALSAKANQLAHQLIELGVATDKTVGICMPRCDHMMVSMLGILIAGGAYVPLDVKYPDERLRFMIEDSSAQVVICLRKQVELLTQIVEGLEVQLLVIDDPQTSKTLKGLSTDAPDIVDSYHSDNLAYMIYTSGSTGKPKGVMINHNSATNYLHYAAQTYLTDEIEGSVVSSPLVFDATITTLWPPLMVGKSVELLLDNDNVLEQLADYLADEDESLLFKITPAHLDALALAMPEEGCDAEHMIIIGGEQLTRNCLQPWHDTLLPQATFVNEYGPTETVVGCSVYTVEPGDEIAYTSVPIGQAIANTQLYVLDQYGHEQPLGAIGELYIGGAGLARGYKHLPQMTEERFVSASFDREIKLYRTGDLVRFNNQGQLTFLGRVDSQVKIRGFRIELGEVESHFTQMNEVKEVVVICHSEDEGNIRDKTLVAYVVAHQRVSESEQEAFVEQLKAQLTAKVPDYMVPSVIMTLDALPLTNNGKVDRQRLPQPTMGASAVADIVPPNNEVETIIHDIWCQLLGVKHISVEDNFFEVGGDSIVSIQVVSRCRKAGIKVNTKQLFAHPTVRGLASCCTQIQSAASEGQVISGESLLLPVQQDFLNRITVDNHHFNQSILLDLPASFDPQLVKPLVSALVERHDALRLVFNCDEQGVWQGQHLPLDQQLVAQMVICESDVGDVFERCRYWQTQFDLAKGPLLRVVLFDHCPTGSGMQLLLLAHHMVVDVVSWRIIMADFAAAYEQLEQGQSVNLGAKSTSFKRWAQQLSDFAQNGGVSIEKAYWLKQYLHPIAEITYKQESDDTTVASSVKVACQLSTEDTRYLLTDGAKAFNTQVNELLLSCLYLAMRQWRGKDGIRVLLEGHGREDLIAGVDLSETVGWFTSLYPLTLECKSAAIDEVIMAIKEQYREVPNKGIGYGLLHDILVDEELVKLAGRHYPQLCFNYLGQLDQSLNAQGEFALVEQTDGQHVSGAQPRLNDLTINAHVLNGQLSFEVDYCQNQFSAERMKKLTQALLAGVDTVLTECRQSKISRYTPSDFPLARAGQQQLDDWAYRYPNVQNIYPATLMQQGILFTSMLDVSTYMIQVCVDLSGDLNLSLFKQAWQNVVARHDILRSAFVGVQKDLHQVVVDDVTLGWELLDWCDKDQDAVAREFESYMETDRLAGFDFEVPGLMRLTLITLSDDEVTRYRLVWCHHHILTDGWSSALIYKEVMTCYQNLVAGVASNLAPAPSYGSYVEWLLEQDDYRARQFWKKQLSEVTNATPLMVDKLDRVKQAAYQRQQLLLSEAQTAGLVNLAKRQHTTVNNLLQVAWGYLLYRYSAEPTVTFGVTVSGRDIELDEVENTVGLFINSIPLVVNFDSDATTAQVISAFHQQFQKANEYSLMPLSEIQRCSKVPSGEPLFDTLLMFANYPIEADGSNDDSGVSIDKVWVDDRAHFKIALDASVDSQLKVVFGYDNLDFSDDIIAAMMAHLEQILMSFESHLQQDIRQIEILTDEHKAHLEAFNDTDEDCPLDVSVIKQFEQQVARVPEAVAVEYQDTTISYQTLNDNANKFAHVLVDESTNGGVNRDDVVAVLTHRTPEFLTAILAIHKAGGAYLPLDPYNPASRHLKVLKQCGAKAVIVEQALYDTLQASIVQLPEDSCPKVLVVEQMHEGPSGLDNLPVRNDPDSLAYVLFTSGSTGVPKGAMIENRGLINHLRTKVADLALDEHSVIAQTASQCFDISVWQFFTALMIGGRVNIFTKEEAEDPSQLMPRVISHQVTALEVVPSIMRMFIESMESQFKPLNHLRWLIPTGEVLPVPLAARWLTLYPQIPILNAYGPTECTDDVCIHRLDVMPQYDMLSIPIGKPVGNFKLHVLNEQLQQVPIGVIGELYIAGMGVGRGYLGDKQKTLQTFVPDIFSDESGKRMYKSGDLVRRLPDGSLDFVGRSDQQVKIRGFRIELGEIESQLVQLDLLSAAVVVVRGEGSNVQLVGYVIAHQPQGGYATEQEFNQAVSQGLKQALPDYMVPTILVEMEEFPLNNNGKVDKKALPAVGAKVTTEQLVMPKNETETKLVTIWCDALGVDEISTDANFFEKGGHSLMAMRLVSACAAEFGIELSLVSVYENYTIDMMAKHIATMDKGIYHGIEPQPRHEYMPLSYGQQSLWIIDELSNGSPQYNIPAAFEIKGQLDIDILHLALDELIERHEILRTVYVNQDGEGMQLIREQASSEIAEVDLSDLTAQEQTRQLEDLKATEAVKTFNLSEDIPLRATLVKLADESYVMLFTMHHIASDAWSVSILLRETMSFYNSFIMGEEFDLPALPIQYADYAAWQRDNVSAEQLELQLNFWTTRLKNVPKLHGLPTSYIRPPQQDYVGQTFVQKLAIDKAKALNDLASRRGVSLFILMQTAFSVVVGQLSHQQDVVIGSPVAGRSRKEIETLIGYFVNVLILRTDLSGDPRFKDLLEICAENALEAFDHQDMPFEMLVEGLQPDRSLSHASIFQLVFSLRNTETTEFDFAGLQISDVSNDDVNAKFDLVVNAEQSEDGITVHWIYAKSLFSPEYIELVASCYEALLDLIVENSRQTLSQLQSRLSSQLARISTPSKRVEFNGYLLELELVDKAIEQTDGVNQVLTRCIDNEQGEHLVVYAAVSIEESEYLSFKQMLLQSLSAQFPDYMVPEDIVLLAELPVDEQGDVDVQALPRVSADDAKEFVHPSTDTEIALALIWQEILSVDKICTTDGFFSMGGQSLTAIRLLVEIKNQFTIELSLKDVFQYQTFFDMAAFIDAEKVKLDNENVADDDDELFDIEL